MLLGSNTLTHGKYGQLTAAAATKKTQQLRRQLGLPFFVLIISTRNKFI
jgi:hypothetical protein